MLSPKVQFTAKSSSTNFDYGNTLILVVNIDDLPQYRGNGRLYAVQAIKVGPVANASGPLETPFDFKVYAFNGNEEVPMFAHEGTMRAERHFVDGREALAKDFFKP